MKKNLFCEGIHLLVNRNSPEVAAAVFSEVIDAFASLNAYFWRGKCYKEMVIRN